MKRVKSSWRLPLLGVAALGGIAAARWSVWLLQPGPLNSFVAAAGRTPSGREVVFGFMVVVTIYNAIALGLTLWDQKAPLVSSPLAALSLLTLVFFIGEQFAVGGNIPFYDRYALQVAPFLGIIAFAVLPALSNGRLLALGAMSVVSHVMVWRYLSNS